MGLFKVVPGDSTDLEEIEKKPGYAYYTQDDNKFHIDTDGAHRQTIDANGSDGVYIKNEDDYVHTPNDTSKKGVLIPGEQLVSHYFQQRLPKGEEWIEKQGVYSYVLEDVFDKRRDNILIPPIISPLRNIAEYSMIENAEVKDGSDGKVSIEFTTQNPPTQEIDILILVV